MEIQLVVRPEDVNPAGQEASGFIAAEEPQLVVERQRIIRVGGCWWIGIDFRRIGNDWLSVKNRYGRLTELSRDKLHRRWLRLPLQPSTWTSGI